MQFGPVEKLFGPILVGAFINVFLWGTVTMQYMSYIKNFKKDRAAIKLLVHILFILDILNSIFNMIYVYLALVRHFGDTERLVIFDVYAQSDPILTGLIASIVQLFFAWRLQRLTSRIWLTVIITIGSITQLAGAIISTVQGALLVDIPLFFKLEATVIVWLGAAAVTDVIIAVALVLHFSKRRTGFASTDEILDRISRLAIETGALTSIVAVLNIIAFVVSKDSALYILFGYPLTKLYSNSLLVSLNSRSRVSHSGIHMSAPGGSVPLNFLSSNVQSANPQTGDYRGMDVVDVKVLVEQHSDSDVSPFRA